MRIPLLSVTLVLMLVFAASANAAILHVPGEYSTIKAAVDAAVDGDQVLVAPGVYTGNENRNIDFLGKDLDVIGTGGAAVTIIDGQNFGRGFVLRSGEPPSASIEGLTIRNGQSFTLAEFGGGIYCADASVSIRDCVIEDCWAANEGGGIFLWPQQPSEVVHCTLRRNSARTETDSGGSGGGISAFGPVTIRNCNVEFNDVNAWFTPGMGAGVFLSRGAIVENCRIAFNGGRVVETLGGGVAGYDFTIRSCDIVGNVADVGGGIWIGEDASIEDCLITGNLALSAGGGVAALSRSVAQLQRCTISANVAEGKSAYGGGGIYCGETSHMNVHETILWGNCSVGGYPGAHILPGSGLGVDCSDWRVSEAGGGGTILYSVSNIELDPGFCGPLSCPDAPSTGGDYSVRDDSPCLPSGNPCGVLIGARGPACGATPVKMTSWGGLKARFR